MTSILVFISSKMMTRIPCPLVSCQFPTAKCGTQIAVGNIHFAPCNFLIKFPLDYGATPTSRFTVGIQRLIQEQIPVQIQGLIHVRCRCRLIHELIWMLFERYIVGMVRSHHRSMTQVPVLSLSRDSWSDRTAGNSRDKNPCWIFMTVRPETPRGGFRGTMWPWSNGVDHATSILNSVACQNKTPAPEV